MQRYFLNDHQLNGEIITITGDDYHHIVHVMRLKIGDKIAIVFPEGKVAICELFQIEKESVTVKIREWVEENRELPIEVTIGSALLKGDKFDIVVQKGTELGAKRFIPFQATNSVVKLDDSKGKKRQRRWQKIAKEAAEQSERLVVPKIDEPLSFDRCLKIVSQIKWKIVAYEMEARSGESFQFYNTLQQVKKGDSIFLMFGPEGGFSEAEIEKLKEEGFISIGLGPRILRAETAPLYALSAISFHFELSR
ncbi:16S rRNA (uracil(1498)-N(3))-methyltransferase [Fervidibacillus halotolerans]|uniref:Ribosomal RNA small subunit methyltransferase E n=1 Tax=Fervidibacillus halotolerans TaxID=2980027 RepID=A0A9E8RZC5_9BACI|nr:16S rRNA (uracil(1498)-N(3))-methyltransferase [Fervidibacillus halotolerans]WAA11507.1 16S rRNA (uracil(1498)-N(3))-methyltransferase [Fervidibacillus halotolerans]